MNRLEVSLDLRADRRPLRRSSTSERLRGHIKSSNFVQHDLNRYVYYQIIAAFDGAKCWLLKSLLYIGWRMVLLFIVLFNQLNNAIATFQWILKTKIIYNQNLHNTHKK